MRRKAIFFLTSFDDLKPFYNANKEQLKIFQNEFNKVFIVNSENLKLYDRKLKYSDNVKKKFPKKILFKNPKNLKEFNNLCIKYSPLIINNIGRGFEYFPILFNLQKLQLPQILLGHIGNIQFSTYYWHKTNFKIVIFFFSRFLPRLVSRLFVILKIFSPIEIRFVSNKLIYQNFKKTQKKFFKIPSYYKEIYLVKSKVFDDLANNDNRVKEKYLLHLDMQPEYRSMQDIKILDNQKINDHYKQLNEFLKNLSKKLGKKVLISIHPAYDMKITKQRFKNFKVFKFKTKELIRSASIILFFDTSAIIPAFVLKKKVICLRADLFKGKRYNSDLYKGLLNLKSLKINTDLKSLDKKKFLNDLEKRTKSYKKYLNNYTSSNLSLSGTESIIKVIKKRYFN